MDIVNNFKLMPTFLKLCTACALGLSLALASTLLPGVPIRLFGHAVTHAEWWATGAGQYMLIVAALMAAAAAMMLIRVRHSRLAYITAWIALSFSIPFLAGVTGHDVTASNSSLIFNLLLTLAIALYLYFSKGSRIYFSSRRADR